MRAATAALGVGLGVALGTLGACVYRRRHLRWGARPDEVTGAMPGDDLLARAEFVATRAISIAAPPDEVWPWLVQVGFRRAGFYSYDLLDNLGRRSAREILPEFQELGVGDLAAPMASPPDERTAFTVQRIEPPHVLVWAKPDSTWSWMLTEELPGRTRLLTRLKARYDLGPFLPVTLLLMEVADFPMMRRMLLGIRERAEASRETGAAPASP
ncbi:hypothetical protein OEB99_04970 [Actinotalea sp. M2MS4P-6]|uniref:hypothetical protein n=1 Tax=Actinotalea sp. M2MS4P-6 TaxID=2983762 RepID=UPI0021E51171|nr:hypothetical protein [Actinotalea sp. M2MS4P-6]MCV2393653.1 hypothetical protein [Actinotalea sp. M2MS4P-6]